MKKLSLCLLAALALAVSCSKQNVETPEVDSNDSWLNNVNLPVPIQFSSSAIKTKALVDEGTFETLDNIGVLAVQPKYGATHPAWSASSQGTVLLNNEAARIASAKVEFTNGTQYYPIVSSNHYSFFAYYPRVEAAGTYGEDDFAAGLYSVTPAEPAPDTEAVVEEGFKVVYDLSASNYGIDVLWAKSEAKTPEEFNMLFGTTGAYLGYNAKYIRAINKAVENDSEGLIPEESVNASKPSLTFSHLLTALDFKAQLLSSGAKVPYIQKVVLKNVAKKVELTVVDNNIALGEEYVSNSGTVDVVEIVDVVEGEEVVRTYEDYAVVNPVELTLEGEKITTSPLIVMPADSYVIDIWYSMNADDDEAEWDVAPNNTITGAGGTPFLAGNHYTVVIQLNALMEIDITAQITPWSEVIVDLPLE